MEAFTRFPGRIFRITPWTLISFISFLSILIMILFQSLSILHSVLGPACWCIATSRTGWVKTGDFWVFWSFSARRLLSACQPQSMWALGWLFSQQQASLHGISGRIGQVFILDRNQNDIVGKNGVKEDIVVIKLSCGFIVDVSLLCLVDLNCVKAMLDRM